MSKQLHKNNIKDIHNEGCDECEKEVLCDIFEFTVKRMACTLVRKVWFELADFHNARERGIEEFTLTLERHLHGSAEQWIGLFEARGRKLKVMGIPGKI